MSPPKNHLRPVQTQEDWAAYHAIRRDSIFALYFPGQVYDDKHPDERKPENLPHIFTRNDEIVGVVRIDLLDVDRAAFRLFGIKKNLQGQGLGTRMLRMAEELMLKLGKREIVINSTIPALSFYLANGYTPGEWHDIEPLREDLVRIGKRVELLETNRAQSKSDIIVHLMIFCGMVLPILALPVGLELFCGTYFVGHAPLRQALEVMAQMILLMVVTGLILFSLGKYLLKRLMRSVDPLSKSRACSRAEP